MSFEGRRHNNRIKWLDVKILECLHNCRWWRGLKKRPFHNFQPILEELLCNSLCILPPGIWAYFTEFTYHLSFSYINSLETSQGKMTLRFTTFEIYWGPSIKYVTLLLTKFDHPLPCHTLSHLSGPF